MTLHAAKPRPAWEVAACAPTLAYWERDDPGGGVGEGMIPGVIGSAGWGPTAVVGSSTKTDRRPPCR